MSQKRLEALKIDREKFEKGKGNQTGTKDATSTEDESFSEMVRAAEHAMYEIPQFKKHDPYKYEITGVYPEGGIEQVLTDANWEEPENIPAYLGHGYMKPSRAYFLRREQIPRGHYRSYLGKLLPNLTKLRKFP
jgi:hypothetical protein